MIHLHFLCSRCLRPTIGADERCVWCAPPVKPPRDLGEQQDTTRALTQLPRPILQRSAVCERTSRLGY